jgi:hypothetical protein
MQEFNKILAKHCQKKTYCACNQSVSFVNENIIAIPPDNAPRTFAIIRVAAPDVDCGNTCTSTFVPAEVSSELCQLLYPPVAYVRAGI